MKIDSNDTETSVPSSSTATSTDVTTTSKPTETVATVTATEHDVVDTTDAYGNVVKSVEGVYNRVYEVVKDDEDSSDADESNNSSNVGDSNNSNNTVESEDTSDNSNNSDTTDEENTDKTNYLSNKYIYQSVNVNAKNVSFVLTGQAQGVSVPLSNENRTFGIALNVYYQGEDAPESHYQSFNSNTTSVQSVSLSVTPEEANKMLTLLSFMVTIRI